MGSTGLKKLIRDKYFLRYLDDNVKQITHAPFHPFNPGKPKRKQNWAYWSLREETKSCCTLGSGLS